MALGGVWPPGGSVGAQGPWLIFVGRKRRKICSYVIVSRASAAYVAELTLFGRSVPLAF